MDHWTNRKTQHYETPRSSILEENLDDVGYGNGFLDTTLKAWSMKNIIDKLNFTKIKDLCLPNNTDKRMKRKAIWWEKILVKNTSDKELLSKTYKELLRYNNEKTNNLVRKQAKHLSRHLTKEDLQITSKWRDVLIMSLGKCKLKQWDTTHLSAWPRSRMLTIPTAGEEVSNMSSHSLPVGIQNHKGSLEFSYKTKPTLYYMIH